jgi:hypothetical protein
MDHEEAGWVHDHVSGTAVGAPGIGPGFRASASATRARPLFVLLPDEGDGLDLPPKRLDLMSGDAPEEGAFAPRPRIHPSSSAHWRTG